MNADRPFSLNQISIRTGLPRDWLRERAERGDIPCLRVGGKLLFNLAAVERAIAELAAHSREGRPCPA